jgi:hypothetical protein
MRNVLVTYSLYLKESSIMENQEYFNTLMRKIILYSFSLIDSIMCSINPLTRNNNNNK